MKRNMMQVLTILSRSFEARKANPKIKQAKKIPSKRIVANARATISVNAGFLFKSKIDSLKRRTIKSAYGIVAKPLVDQITKVGVKTNRQMEMRATFLSKY